MKVSIRDAAKALGISQETLRRWEATGKITAERTAGGHRRYDLVQLRKLLAQLSQPAQRVTLAYARVASPTALELLTQQKTLIESYCTAHKWPYELIYDFGSGISAQKPGIHQLVERICGREVERLVIVHPDRLLRFASDLILYLCAFFGTEVVIIRPSDDCTDAEDLQHDLHETRAIFTRQIAVAPRAAREQLLSWLDTFDLADGGMTPP